MQINNPGGTAGGSLATNTHLTLASREPASGRGVNYIDRTATTVDLVYSHTDF